MDIFEAIRQKRNKSKLVKEILEANKNAVRATTTSFLTVLPDGYIRFVGDRWTPLHHAAMTENTFLSMGMLIKAGADIDASSGPKYGYTPLHCAAIAGILEHVKFLIERGADLSAKSAKGETMLDVARSEVKAYYENSMNASDDATIVAYIWGHIEDETRARLEHVLKSKNRKYDVLFALLAWYVYHVIMKKPSMAHLEDALFKKIARTTKYDDENQFSNVISEFGNNKTQKNSESMRRATEKFIDMFNDITDRLVDGYHPDIYNRNAAKNLLLKRIRDVAKSTRNSSSIAPAMSKKIIARGLANWTTMTYRKIQNAHRTGANNLGGHAATNLSLALHMRNYAPRAPEIIPGIERPTYLYRGMHGPMSTSAVLDKGLTNWKGYLAFSRNERISRKFGKTSPDEARTNLDHMGHVLFRLKLDDVPRGTPWIWYLAAGTKEAEMRRKRNTAVSGLPEDEVLMPPGRLEFKSQGDRDIARGIREGIDAATRGNNGTNNKNSPTISRPEKGFISFKFPPHLNLAQIARAMTIALINEPNKKNVTLIFGFKYMTRIAHMVQLALLDRGIVDYVIDPFMFNDPLLIDVVYVQDRNAQSVAYSVRYRRNNNNERKTP